MRVLDNDFPRVSVTLAQRGDLVGYQEGVFGLANGSLPGFLFRNNLPREPREFYEAADGTWILTYTNAGAPDGFLPNEALDAIVLVLVTEDGREQGILLGSAVLDRGPALSRRMLHLNPAGAELLLHPRVGETIQLRFETHPRLVLEPVTVAPVGDPTDLEPGSFLEWVLENTQVGALACRRR